MASFSFLSLWELTAPIEHVWAEVSRPEEYPRWLPYVVSVEQVSPGDAAGIGATHVSRWKTALPYGFAFQTRVIRSEPPHLHVLESSGDLEGTGRWELQANATGTTVRYYWQVRPTQSWFNLIAPLARPAFEWNHDVIMHAGGEGLARLLGARLTRNEAFSASSTSPLRPIVSILGPIALAIMLVRQLRCLLPGG